MLLKNFRTVWKLKPVLAVALLFASSSLLFGTWVAAIPSIKQRFGFTDGTLGLTLLFSPLGAITGVFISTRIFSRISVGKWMLAGYLTLAFIMVLQVNALNKTMLCICLYSFGVVSFLNGVAANATVNLMEKKYDKLLMSSCHAMYSLGGALSAAIVAVLVLLYIPRGWQIVIIALLVYTITISNRKQLLSHTDIIHSGTGLKLPSASVLGISFICMVLFMAEGCVADWSGIYLKEVLHAPKIFISLGYGVFAVAMTIGRLNGDRFVEYTGNKKAVILGSLLACVGFLIVVTAPVTLVALAGFMIVGFGCSSIVPILFRTSANIPGLSRVEGFAMVTTGGLIGFLSGPSIIGFISEKSGLGSGLSLLILMTLLAAVVAWKNQFITPKSLPEVSLNIDEQLY
ncbi:MAG: MFS transporter [Ferruginibacter sp.]